MDIISLLPILLIAAAGGLCFFIFTRFLVNVGSDEIAVTERQFVGSELAPGRVFALDNEVGLRASYLAPGLHFIPWPVVKLSNKPKFLNIDADELGIIEATDGVYSVQLKQYFRENVWPERWVKIKEGKKHDSDQV